MPLASIWALVPVKPLHEAKSRLACVLSPQERAELVCTLLTRTLHVLVNCSALAGVLVISADGKVGELAIACGADFVPEAPPCDLNISLTTARDTAMQHGAEGVLIVPADLPCVDAKSIMMVLDTASKGKPKLNAVTAHPSPLPSPVTDSQFARMVIVPDRHQEGTNCLFIAPPDAIDLRFGEQSMVMHIAAAHAAGLSVTVLETSPLSLDVDLPDDLEVAGYCLKPVA